MFTVEACAHSPAHILHPCGVSCIGTVDLDPSHVVCNFNRLVASLSYCCPLDSRSAVTGPGVDLLSPPTSFAVYLLLHSSSMPGAPTKSTMDNIAAARQKVGPPSILGAHPNSHFLKQMSNYQRMDMFNTMFNFYLNGRFFKQESAHNELGMEDPRALTELLTHGGHWYDAHFRRVSKMITMLLRHSDDRHIRLLRKNRIQGDIVLIDFLQTDVMKRNFPTLCPASLWAMALCMTKKRFTFGAVTGTNHLRGGAAFTLGLDAFPSCFVHRRPFLGDHKRDPRGRVRGH